MVLWNAISEKMLFISAERVEDGLYKNSRNKTCWMRKVKIWMSLVPQKRKDEEGFSLYSWRKTYEKVSEMNSDSFLEEAWTSKVTDGREGQNFWEIKGTRFSTCYFPTTPINYSTGEFLSGASKYSRINQIQKVLWLSAFLYLPHIRSIARILFSADHWS